MTVQLASSLVNPDPNNPSVRILVLGLEGSIGTSRLLTLGTTTVIPKKRVNTLKDIVIVFFNYVKQNGYLRI